MHARRWTPAFPTRLHSLLLCAALEANSEHSKTRHEQDEPRTEKTKQDECQCDSSGGGGVAMLPGGDGSTTAVLAAVGCSAVQHSRVQCSAVQYSSLGPTAPYCTALPNGISDISARVVQ